MPIALVLSWLFSAMVLVLLMLVLCVLCSRAGVVLMALVLALAFAAALAAFAGLHWHMVARNYTSIESLDYGLAAAWPHDKGAKRNADEVFGRRHAPPCLPLLAQEGGHCLGCDWMIVAHVAAASGAVLFVPLA